ncbi:MAG TPA: hypothetical protein VLE23_05510, partial [Geminicoccaceae bacterium]|nr:hypothetical protein [Geminicoccaceae bacterium]
MLGPAGRARIAARGGRSGIRPFVVALHAALALGGCGAQSQAEGAPAVQVNRITLEDRPADRAQLGMLKLEAGFALGAADPRFGGLSGLWLAPDGTQLIAASDRGTLWRATLAHAADGRLIDVRDWQAVEPGRT